MPKYLGGSASVRLCTANLGDTTTKRLWTHVGKEPSAHLEVLHSRFLAAENNRLREDVIASDDGIASRLRFIGPEEDMPFYLVKACNDKTSHVPFLADTQASVVSKINDAQESVETVVPDGITLSGSNGNLSNLPLDRSHVPTPKSQGEFLRLQAKTSTANDKTNAPLKRSTSPLNTVSNGSRRDGLPLKSNGTLATRDNSSMGHLEAQESPNNGSPQALFLMVELHTDCYLYLPKTVQELDQPASAAKALDLKIDVYLNGMFEGSTFLPARTFHRDEKKEKIHLFHGRRVSRLTEKPWILVPHGQNADGTLRELKRIQGGPAGTQHRWDTINNKLRAGAETLGRTGDDKLTVLGQYLQSVAETPAPPNLQRPGGLKFGVIDVVITVGRGKKDDSKTTYLLEPKPTRLRNLSTQKINAQSSKRVQSRSNLGYTSASGSNLQDKTAAVCSSQAHTTPKSDFPAEFLTPGPPSTDPSAIARRLFANQASHANVTGIAPMDLEAGVDKSPSHKPPGVFDSMQQLPKRRGIYSETDIFQDEKRQRHLREVIRDGSPKSNHHRISVESAVSNGSLATPRTQTRNTIPKSSPRTLPQKSYSGDAAKNGDEICSSPATSTPSHSPKQLTLAQELLIIEQQAIESVESDDASLMGVAKRRRPRTAPEFVVGSKISSSVQPKTYDTNTSTQLRQQNSVSTRSSEPSNVPKRRRSRADNKINLKENRPTLPPYRSVTVLRFGNEENREAVTTILSSPPRNTLDFKQDSITTSLKRPISPYTASNTHRMTDTQPTPLALPIHHIATSPNSELLHGPRTALNVPLSTLAPNITSPITLTSTSNNNPKLAVTPKSAEWHPPALSEDCIVTYAPGHARQKQAERAGAFAEQGVLLGVRYILM